MRFLGIGRYNDLAAMYHGLARRGHEVVVAPDAQEPHGPGLRTTSATAAIRSAAA